MTSSRIAGFYNLPLGERLEKLAEAAGLDPGDLAAFQVSRFSPEQANDMVENAVGVFGLPLGMGLNFIVNGREVLILSLIHISEPTRLGMISYAVFCLK